MLARRIIPCLDVSQGRVVKGVNFINLRDAGDPVEQARVYDAEGADELVFLDITATHEARQTVMAMARAVADQVFIPFTVGGGIRTVDDMRAILRSGADKISINSAAVRQPDLIAAGAEAFGSQAVVVAIDARRAAAGEARWEVYVSGGRIPTGLDAVEWAYQAERRGAGEILLASMDRDGTQAGYDIALTQATGEATFWSRSRQELWHKGETSGHTQRVREIRYDCDGDTLLVLVDPAGPACHTGATSCFFRRLTAAADGP